MQPLQWNAALCRRHVGSVRMLAHDPDVDDCPYLRSPPQKDERHRARSASVRIVRTPGSPCAAIGSPAQGRSLPCRYVRSPEVTLGLAATFDHRTYRSAPVPECTDSPPAADEVFPRSGPLTTWILQCVIELLAVAAPQLCELLKHSSPPFAPPSRSWPTRRCSSTSSSLRHPTASGVSRPSAECCKTSACRCRSSSSSTRSTAWGTARATRCPRSTRTGLRRLLARAEGMLWADGGGDFRIAGADGATPVSGASVRRRGTGASCAP